MKKTKGNNRQSDNAQPSPDCLGLKRSPKAMLVLSSFLLLVVLVWLPMESRAETPEVIVYKSATCGCCGNWVDHMRDAGFKVTTHDRNDMNRVKQEHGVAYKLRSCHTAVVGDYVLEGHVPANDVHRLLQERPAIDGLAVPGMPMGSPGMEGKYKDPYDVITFTKDGKSGVFARH
ncbi:MAG: DUF411 domain-containing protein [Gammaproteobacteria bacterium]|nr:DUF411 domain-containing protein [Gammaproteobacteria bacterium]